MKRRENRDNIIRPVKSKRSRNRILIYCEGEETEPNYFRAFIASLGIDNLDANVYGEGYNTLSLVNRATHLRNNGSYGDVWVVFDKDNSPDFDEAIELANKLEMKIVYSNEAFEIWYLLHFNYITAALSRGQYKEKIESFIQKQSRNIKWKYQKNDPQLFNLLTQYGNLNQAKKWAAQLVEENNTANPSTTVYLLIEFLESLVNKD